MKTDWYLHTSIESLKQFMSHQIARNYPEQFVTTPDLLHVVIPRVEIITEMTVRGEHETLNDVCLAVAVVADFIGCAIENA